MNIVLFYTKPPKFMGGGVRKFNLYLFLFLLLVMFIIGIGLFEFIIIIIIIYNIKIQSLFVSLFTSCYVYYWDRFGFYNDNIIIIIFFFCYYL